MRYGSDNNSLEGTGDSMELLDWEDGKFAICEIQTYYVEISGVVQHCEIGRLYFVGYKLSIFSLFILSYSRNYLHWKEVHFFAAYRVDSAFIQRLLASRENIWNAIVVGTTFVWKRRDMYGSHRELHRCSMIMATANVSQIHERKWRKMNNPMNTSSASRNLRDLLSMIQIRCVRTLWIELISCTHTILIGRGLMIVVKIFSHIIA